jgi:hypothetical protein
MKKHAYPLRINTGLWAVIYMIQKESGVKSLNCALEELLKLGIPEFCKNHNMPVPVIPEEPAKIQQIAIEKVLEDTK